jgi:hypothetical protein
MLSEAKGFSSMSMSKGGALSKIDRPTTTRQVLIASQPSGLPTLENFSLREQHLEPLKHGEVLPFNSSTLPPT